MPTTAKTVLMLGATGTAGRATTRALRDAGHNVVAFGRRDPGLDGVDFHLGEMAHEPDVFDAVEYNKPDVIVSCLASRTGAPADAWRIDHAAHIHVLNAARTHGCPHIVLMSAICVQKPRLGFQQAKLAFEEALINSGLTYSIVRPTALFKSLAGQLERVQAGKPYMMFGDGTLTACKPISDRDLGVFMASCVTDPARHNALLPIGGPGPALTPRDMGAALFELTGQMPQYRSVPPGFLKMIQASLRVGGLISAKLRAKAELAKIGHYYGTESMLVWDAVQGRYNADATPEFGSDTLFDYYQDLIDGTATLERGDHAVF